MKDKKLQIFVSSTFIDLKEERQAAVEAILSSGHIPAGMELFSAGDESQMTVIKRWIDESDVYLLILGGRYGSIDATSKKSYTHLEYEYALLQKKPLFSVVISEKALDEKVQIIGRSAIEDQNPQLLKEFKTIVLSNLIKFWDDKKDIKIAIHETLSDFAYRKDLIGWTRGDKSIDTGFLAEEIARLTKENSILREKLINNENSLHSSYAGLDYNQLSELLNNEFFYLENNNLTLFEFMLLVGEKLSIKYEAVSPEYEKACQKLAKYKLVESIGYGTRYLMFRFTEDGHNYYLKSLLLQRRQVI